MVDELQLRSRQKQCTNFYDLRVKKSNVLVIGYGVTGKSVAQFLLSKGHNVFVYDDDKATDIPNRVITPNWDNIDLVVKSPSVHIMPHNRHLIVDGAMQHEKAICSAFDIFRIYNPDAKIIGVTGTNGKSTTVSLIYHILKSAGVSVALGGNIGIPYFDTLGTTVSSPEYPVQTSKEFNVESSGIVHSMNFEGVTAPANINMGISNNKSIDYYIFEMSSYELTSSKLLNFEIACVLNIQPDHLEFHGSFENYIDAKCKILEHSKYKIISYEDTYTVEQFLPTAISCRRKKSNLSSQKCILRKEITTVSTERDLRADYYIENNLLISNGNAILDVSNLPNLVGKHNSQNLMFAYAICALIGVPNEKIVQGIKTFEPLPHRMNTVRKIDNILFVNDSKATNPTSSATALATFTGYKLFWLVGGRSKHIDPMPYIKKYLASVAKIYLFGESTEEFKKVFHDKPFVDCKTIDIALRYAYQDAKKEIAPSVVLFSPMCSSFDQFDNFEQRGHEFVKLVNTL